MCQCFMAFTLKQLIWNPFVILFICLEAPTVSVDQFDGVNLGFRLVTVVDR